jgi:hypothetical protein
LEVEVAEEKQGIAATGGASWRQSWAPPPPHYSDQIITQLNPQKDSSEEQLQVTLYILSNLLEQRFW